jgi:HD superfamily phosphohydrolase
MGQKLFRDPLYDYIQIDKNDEGWILDLINSPEFQRLRYVSQLGLSGFTYPGSIHSRFSHSLGVFHLMHVCVNHLKKDFHDHINPIDEKTLLSVALLHDLGHSPFSHVTESIFGNHEDRTVEIIRNPKSQINHILSSQEPTLPDQVASLIAKKPIANTRIKLWQKSLISSQLDMDRLDYLRRDSLFSGAEYGNFDLFRIIHTMQLQNWNISSEQMELAVVWPAKSKYAIEEYIFSRFYMYQSVYFHHTTRGFECLLRTILDRARTLATDKNFTNELLPPMKLLLDTSAYDIFIQLTDYMLLAQISLWQQSDDKILQDLSRRFLQRNGISWKEVKDSPMKISQKITRAKEMLQENGYDPDYYLIYDETETSVYKPYRSASNSGEISSVTSILLYDSGWPDTHFCEITEVPGLERLKSITQDNAYCLRFYFPRELENDLKQVLQN